MKFITAAIVLLGYAAVVTYLPVYGESSTSDDYYESSTYDDYYESSTSTYDNSYATSTSTADYPASTSNPDCEGFKITYPSESNLSWYEDSQQEVVFDFGSSKVKEVEYVDLVEYENQTVVDQWATGPWNSSYPKTGLRPIHVSNESGYNESVYYQFFVYAATEEHHHCKYLSVKFKVISKDDDYHKGDDYYPDDDDHYGGDDDHYDDGHRTTTTPYDDGHRTTTTPYYDATTTTDNYWPTSTESESYDDSDFAPYQR